MSIKTELQEVNDKLHHLDLLSHMILRNQFIQKIQLRRILNRLDGEVPESTIDKLNSMIEQVKKIIS